MQNEASKWFAHICLHIKHINAKNIVTRTVSKDSCNFVINHQDQPGKKLRYTSLEGPEAGVYFRGRVRNSDFTVDIPLPSYWKNLVDVDSITVKLQPIGYKQPNIIVKSWDEEKITLQSETGIDCFYHVHASRKDGEPLIPEYEGESPNDYPGNPDQFSIAGHDYGRGM